MRQPNIGTKRTTQTHVTSLVTTALTVHQLENDLIVLNLAKACLEASTMGIELSDTARNTVEGLIWQNTNFDCCIIGTSGLGLAYGDIDVTLTHKTSSAPDPLLLVRDCMGFRFNRLPTPILPTEIRRQMFSQTEITRAVSIAELKERWSMDSLPAHLDLCDLHASIGQWLVVSSDGSTVMRTLKLSIYSAGPESVRSVNVKYVPPEMFLGIKKEYYEARICLKNAAAMKEFCKIRALGGDHKLNAYAMVGIRPTADHLNHYAYTHRMEGLRP